MGKDWINVRIIQQKLMLQLGAFLIVERLFWLAFPQQANTPLPVTIDL